MTDKAPLSLAGRTLRWKFTTGPTANTVYEHTFRTDGTVVWRDVAGAPTEKASTKNRPSERESPSGTRYASFEVAPGLHLVSYLAESGYTLTVLANTNDGRLYGFASSAKEWYPLVGTSEATG